MALYVKREEERSELQQKIATGLQDKQKLADIKAKEVESAFLDNAHETRPAGMIIAVLLILLVIAIVGFALSLS